MSYSFTLNCDGTADQEFVFNWSALPFDFKEYQVYTNIKSRLNTSSTILPNIIVLTNLFNGCVPDNVLNIKLSDYNTQFVCYIGEPFGFRSRDYQSATTKFYMGRCGEQPMTCRGIPNNHFKISYTSTTSVEAGTIFASNNPCMINFTFVPISGN